MMIQLTGRLTTDLAVWMSSFGLGIGLAFPFFAVLIGVHHATAFSLVFFLSTTAAGLLVGGLSFLIARAVVVPRLKGMAANMSRVSKALRIAQFDDDWSRCQADSCLVDIRSRDAMGDLGSAFNGLVKTLFRVHRVDDKLRSFTSAITSELDMREVGETAVAFVVEKVQASAAAVYVDCAGELRMIASSGLREAERVAASPCLRRAIGAQAPVVLELPEDLVLDGVLVHYRPQEVMLLPLRFRDVPLGVLVIAWSQPTDPDTRGLLSQIAKGLALSLNNAVAHEQLERIAALDPLTGLYNRRFGIRRLEEELERAHRDDGSLAVVLFDIDHFKRINDTHGHLAGDRVLRRLAQVAGSCVRKGDVVVRYGGEEFFAVLPGGGIEDAAIVAERIRQMSAQTQCQAESQAVRFTVSLGCAAVPGQPADSAEALLHAADEALYRAKDGGRNRVVAVGLDLPPDAVRELYLVAGGASAAPAPGS